MLCAIYCRISKEDAGSLESESIQNQRELLIKYADENNWEIYKIYQDEDYSGIDSNRPQFNQLIRDCKKARFSIVLCKSQSRFTRDMAIVEFYIHGLFAEWGIRFIGVADNVDTSIKGGKKSRQINGLVNQWYLEDLSENIKLVLDHKRREGKFVGSFASYGYIKDPNDHGKLIVDPKAAEVVQLIYSLYAKGYGQKRISDHLNSMDIPNPTAYKQQAGLNYKNGSAKVNSRLWNKNTIGRILKNPIYKGNMVQGTKAKPSYRSSKLISTPKEEWFVVEGTHQAIISHDIYNKVYENINTDVRQNATGKKHCLAGKVFCGSCKSIMYRSTVKSKGVRRAYLRCKLHWRDKLSCTSHSIPLEALVEKIKERIEFYIKEYGFEYKPQATAKIKASNIKEENKEYILALKLIYIDKAQGKISDEDFLALTKSLKSDQKNKQKAMAEVNPIDQDLLTEELICYMVGRIEVFEEGGEKSVEVHWNF